MEKNFVYINENGQAVTDSITLAEATGRKNYKIVEMIEHCPQKDSFFFEKTYSIGPNRAGKYYEINYDGFTYISNRFKLNDCEAAIMNIKAEFWKDKKEKSDTHMTGVKIEKNSPCISEIKCLLKTYIANLDDMELKYPLLLAKSMLEAIEAKRKADEMESKLKEIKEVLSNHLTKHEYAITDIVKEMSEREKILKLVDEVCEKGNYTHQYVYSRIYGDLAREGYILDGKGYDSKIQEAEARGWLWKVRKTIQKAFGV